MITARPARRLGLGAALLLAAACSDGTGPGEKPGPHPTFPVPDDALAALTCTVDVQSARAACEPESPANGARAAFVLGGQGRNLTLAATNITAAGGVTSFDATLKNLLVFKMGTPDGATVEGIKVFFYAGPTVTRGSGAVSVRNPDGQETFNNGDQPYFRYAQIVGLNETTAAKRWEFDVPASVQAFSFKVYVQTSLLPVVVFDRLAGGNRDVYRVAVDGSDLVRMTTNGGEDMDPTASRDKLVFTSFRDGNAELYSMPLTGGAETRLTNTTAYETDPALSRDGARLAYASDASGVAKIFTATGDATGGARATSAGFGIDGSPEVSPAWWPGGTRLAFVASFSSADIYAMTIPGGTPAALRNESVAEITPSVSPDSTRLSYSKSVSGNTDLYVLTFSTGQAVRLTTRTGTESSGSWTPDGRIVYLANNGGDNELHVIDPATGVDALIPLPGTGRVLRPAAVPFF